MAFNIDRNFKPSSHRPRGRYEAKTFKIPAAAPPPPSPPADSRDRPHNLKDHEQEQENFKATEVKRGLLDIDLNAPPQHDSPATMNSVNLQEGQPTVDAVVVERSQRKWVKNFDGVAGEVVDGDEEERERRERRWRALLDVAEDALREYEEDLGKRERKIETPETSDDRRASQESGLGGELMKGWDTRKTTRDPRRQNMSVAAAAEEAVAPPVARSKRGRAVALPNKYRDSFVGSAVVVEEFSQQRRIGKSAAIVAAHRKPR